MNDDLLEHNCKEVSGFEDVWYKIFELGLHCDVDNSKVTGDSKQEEAAVIMNNGG